MVPTLRLRGALPASLSLGLAATVTALSALVAAPAAAQSTQVSPNKARVQAWQQRIPSPGLAGAGSGAQPEVVDGRPAKAGRWPFTVSLVSRSVADNYAAHFCGGTLLDASNVLTAAHCVVGSRANSMQVLVGTQSLVSGGRRVNVTRVTWHPDFLRGTGAAGGFLQNDVAVLRLQTPVTDVPTVRIAASVEEEDTWSSPGDRLLVMGWGALTFDTDGPEVLYQADLPKNDLADCNALTFYGGNLTERNICAGRVDGAGKSACYGDSGGPLISRGPDGAPLQVGVVSGGPSVCGDLPGYFARVGALADWIKGQQARP
jgi:secreted trypsin-like serine protease